MARLIPQHVEGSPRSENIVIDALRSLDDTWTILWDVPVGLFGKPSADLRQIDVLLLHPHAGLLILEVKGGEIRCDRGDWYTRPRFASSQWIKLKRSPFKQVADARYTLERFLQDKLRVPRRAFGHAVVFPGASVTTDLGPDAPRALVLDADDLRAPERALRRAASAWGEDRRIDPTLLEEVVELLRPSFQLTVLASSAAAETRDQLERETHRQAEMVKSQVEAYRRLLASERVVTIGGAGTGKTVIAARLASQLAFTGTRTLLLCHRAGVQSFIHTLMKTPVAARSAGAVRADDLVVASWTALEREVARALGRTNVSARDPQLGDYFLEFRDVHLPAPFDAVVVDEGQEFSAVQLEALTWLLDDPEKSPFYVFADPYQHSGLFTTATKDRLDRKITFQWEPPVGSEKILLTTNCRNSKPIAQLAANFYPEDAPRALVSGPVPQFHLSSSEKVAAAAARLLQQLVDREGFRPSQLMLIVVTGGMVQADRALRGVGLRTASVGKLFRFPLTTKDARIVVATPDDAQGLEADAVVVMHSGSDLQHLLDRDLYVAMSRARSVLHVVSPLPSEEFLRSVRWRAHQGSTRASADRNDG